MRKCANGRAVYVIMWSPPVSGGEKCTIVQLKASKLLCMRTKYDTCMMAVYT